MGDGGPGPRERAAMDGASGSVAAVAGGGGFGGGREEGMGVEADADGPRDARIVRAILRSMGVVEYEPRVVHQFLELWYRYVVDVLTDAQVYSEHAGKAAIGPDDVKLAIQSKVNFSFSQPPPREVLLELARNRNKVPLPKSLGPPAGIPLPPEQDTLISSNYQLLIPKKPSAAASEGPEEEEEGPANPDSISSPVNMNTSTSTPKLSQDPNPNSGASDVPMSQQQLTPPRVSFPLTAGKRPR